MSKRPVFALLAAGLNRHERKLNQRLIAALEAKFLDPVLDPRSPGAEGSKRAKSVLARRLFLFLKNHVSEELDAILALRKLYSSYAQGYARAGTDEERHNLILTFAADLGASSRQLRGDRKALARWFGHDAITERYTRQHFFLERQLTFALDRLGALADRILAAKGAGAEAGASWSSLELEATLKPFFAYDGDSRVATAAFRALSRALRALPVEMRESSVDEKTLQFIYRSAMHPRLDVWLQCEALSLLESLSPESLEKVIAQRLTRPSPGDDVFVRKRAVKLLARNLRRLPELVSLLPTVAGDPSPFVRQGLAESIEHAPLDVRSTWIRRLAWEDGAPAVRAAAVLAGLRLAERGEIAGIVMEMIEGVLGKDEDPFVLRVACHAAARGAAALARDGSPDLGDWRARSFAALGKVHLESKHIPVRRWAAQAREKVWCECEPRARAAREHWHERLTGMLPGESRWFPPETLAVEDEELLGRTLAVLAQETYGYDVGRTKKGIHVTRGHVLGFRGWRTLHEARNPSPDKRQAFRHTIGRHFAGGLRAPSSILAELAETRVPGEPLFIGEEGGWRPYLPLLDEVLSSLEWGRGGAPVRIFTAEGVTEIVPPAGLVDRARAFGKISKGFPEYAKLRNWRSQLQESPAAYLQALKGLGIQVRFRPHAEEAAKAEDPLVRRFFPAFIPPAGELWDRFREYFVSAYDNSLFELALFTGAACSFFIGRHVYATASVRRWRKRLPLVVGGWGTRGKSGTERLKAALFNALGYGVVSKTTGCEAMFLYAHPFARTREMFLFRSYDKATIWEQRNVIRLADRLGADVFLWECMALTPSYVEVLQHHWVRDDLSTITNTYPDHEDLQGPAGIDIPDVISIFIPPSSRAVTTEEQMLPVLVEKAKAVKTALRCVSWIEPGLIAPDILKRFPYDEHPSNIALVLGLADEMGIDRDFALKEMADRVVPDLGVLKTSPIANVRGRRVQFVNGCSANERHGTLSNWLRCGFNLQDPVAEPGVWITTVVNNRADRVPRSRVFARILVEDIYADRHFLIGGNLNGLVGYIRQSWEAYAPTISLWPKDSAGGPAAVLLEMARRFRLPTEEAHLQARLKAMLAGADLPPGYEQGLEALLRDLPGLEAKLAAAGLKDRTGAILRHHQANLQVFAEYEAFRQELAGVPEDRRPALDASFRDLLWKWFQAKLVVVHDYYISGEQLVNLIVEETPPGYLNRIMGIQNIKGTGLDFVYRWQAWDTCYRACQLLLDGDATLAERGLRDLAAFHEYGVLSQEHVAATLEAVKKSPVAQSERFQAELALIESNYNQAMAELKEKLGAMRREAGRLEKVVNLIENFLDAGDAVRRRKIANRIYADLVTDRISSERAALELQNLNKRQKGGWLLQKVLSAQSFVRKNLGAFIARGAFRKMP